jgi:hypothetical protein
MYNVLEYLEKKHFFLLHQMLHLATASPVSSLGLENTSDNRGSLESEGNQTRGDTIINITINKGNAMSAKREKNILQLLLKEVFVPPMFLDLL